VTNLAKPKKNARLPRRRCTGCREWMGVTPSSKHKREVYCTDCGGPRSVNESGRRAYHQAVKMGMTSGG
jgi:rRNA maturation endonuclease Nob1